MYKKIDTIFINSSKTFDSDRLLLNFRNIVNFKKVINILLYQILAYYMYGKILKIHTI